MNKREGVGAVIVIVAVLVIAAVVGTWYYLSFQNAAVPKTATVVTTSTDLSSTPSASSTSLYGSSTLLYPSPDGKFVLTVFVPADQDPTLNSRCPYAITDSSGKRLVIANLSPTSTIYCSVPQGEEGVILGPESATYQWEDNDKIWLDDSSQSNGKDITIIDAPNRTASSYEHDPNIWFIAVDSSLKYWIFSTFIDAEQTGT